MATTKQSEPKSGAKKSSTAKKITERVENPYTGYYQIIEGKSEVELENKRQALYEKWAREQAKEDAKRQEEEYKLREQQEQADYIRNMHNEAAGRTKEAQTRLQKLKQLHYFPKPIITSVESYVHANATAEVKKRRVLFPDKEDYMREEKIGWLKKKLHGIKNEWYSESFERAEKAYQEALMKANEEQADSDKEYTRAIKEKEIPYRKKMGHMALGKEEDVLDYFFHALDFDTFNLIDSRFIKRYFTPANYSSKTKELSFGYRIPCLQEFDLFESVSYNERNNEFVYHDYSPPQLQQHALEIAESILLRTIIVLFSSDEYQVLKSVDLTGVITYMDDAYGKEIIKPVMHVKMTKQQFNELGNLDKVNSHSLFSRVLNVEIADGLYSKKDYEIPELKHEE